MDSSGIATVTWTRTADGEPAESGIAYGKASWTTTPVPLVAGKANVVTATATDVFGNQGVLRLGSRHIVQQAGGADQVHVQVGQVGFERLSQRFSSQSDCARVPDYAIRDLQKRQDMESIILRH